MGFWCRRRLAEGEVPLSDRGRIRGLLEYVCLGVCCPAKRCLRWLMVLRRLTPGGTCPPPGGLAATGGTCPPPGDFFIATLGCWSLYAWSTRLLVMLQRWDCWVPWVELGTYPLSWARDRGYARSIPQVELGMASLELSSRWRMNTRDPWVELGLASVVGVSVLVVASTDGSRWIALLSDELTSLVVLGCLYRNSTWRYGVWSVAWFPAHALSVVADRYGSKSPWGNH